MTYGNIRGDRWERLR